MNRKTTLLSLKCLFVFAFAQMLNAQQIYTNGPLSTGATSLSGAAAPAGYTWSELQHNTGNTSTTNNQLGSNGWYNTLATSTFLNADDFIVPTGQVWDVTSFEFYAYQTNQNLFPFDELRVMIYNGVPGAAGTTLVAGSATTNVLDVANSGDAMMYRINNSQVPTVVASPGLTRRIWKLRGNITASLQAGTYWVVYQFHASNNNAALSPLVAVPGVRGVAGANAKTKISATAAWTNIADVGAPALPGGEVASAIPFIINGTTGVASVANDACSGALAAGILPYNHVQTLGNLSTNNGGFLTGCTTAMNDGLWYTFTGDGGNTTVSITGLDVLFDAQLDVYTGACGAFTGCVGSSDQDVDGGDESVTFISTVGTTYYVNVGNYGESVDGSEGNFTINIDSVPLGNSTFTNGSFKAYPNPVKNILNLSYDQEISNVEVYNLLGQQVMAKAINATQSTLDVAALTPGTYMMKVFSGNESQTVKVVKN